MQTLKQKGFTLIELLVVIVIIGILATISVATFSGYFAKARDSERQAGIHNAATILKTARAVDTISSFVTLTTDVASGTGSVVGVLSTEGGYSLPAANPGNFYYYSSGTSNFVIFVCSEAASAAGANGNGYFRDGTATDVATLDAEGTMSCAAGVETLGAGTIGTAVATDSAGSGDLSDGS